MGEYFEIAFFDQRSDNGISNLLAGLNLSEGRNIVHSHSYSLLSDREVLIDVFKEKDFFEYRFCISNLIFRDDNIESQLKALLKLVNFCFEKRDSILFATGIYELTYYYTKNISYIKDISHHILSHFPFVFWKGTNIYKLSPVYQYKNIFYTINGEKSGQNILCNLN